MLPLLLLFLAACGRKGPLMPPEALVPASVNQLSVQQQGADLVIAWSAPTKEKGGRPLRDLSGFSLYRRTVPGDGSDCPACPDSWMLLKSVDVALSGDVVRSGSTFIYRDLSVAPGTTSQYRVVALSSSGGFSAPVSSPARKLVPPVPAPSATVTALPGSIRIGMEAAPSLKESFIGFNIYRQTGDASRGVSPVNPSPVAEAAWDDQLVRFGSRYRYRVTSLHKIDGETIESLQSPETEILFSLQKLR